MRKTICLFVLGMVFVNSTLADKTTEVFIIEPNDLIAASFAPGGFLAPVPAGITLLSEPGLEQGGLFAVKLRDVANQVIGFGTEQQEVDFPAARVKTTWTLTLVGRGTLFLTQTEDISNLVQNVTEMVATGELVRTFDPPLIVATTIAGSGAVIGGTGEFDKAKGSVTEIDTVYGIDLIQGKLNVADRLEVELQK